MTKILVAEDERGTRLIIKRILEKEGYEVVEASDGSSALETAALHKPELILLDITMPVMDGFEVLQRLRGNPDTATVPVVILTGMEPQAGEPTGARLGVRHYITKPVDPEKLKLAIKIDLRVPINAGMPVL